MSVIVSVAADLQRRPFDGVQQQPGPGGYGRIDVLHRGQEAAESVGHRVLQQVVFGHSTDVQEPAQHCHLLDCKEYTGEKLCFIRNA